MSQYLQLHQTALSPPPPPPIPHPLTVCLTPPPILVTLEKKTNGTSHGKWYQKRAILWLLLLTAGFHSEHHNKQHNVCNKRSTIYTQKKSKAALKAHTHIHRHTHTHIPANITHKPFSISSLHSISSKIIHCSHLHTAVQYRVCITGKKKKKRDPLVC